MSIASEIQALQQDKSDIATAISNKGVTVPSGSGFDSFAGLIGSIATGYKIQYITDYFVGTKSTLEYSLDFEPKAFLLKCNETPQAIYDNTELSSKTNTLAIISGFYFKENFIEGLSVNLPSMLWIKKTATSVAPEIMQRNLGGMMTVSYNSTTEKWDVTLGIADAGNYAYRFALGSAYFQVIFMG